MKSLSIGDTVLVECHELVGNFEATIVGINDHIQVMTSDGEVFDVLFKEIINVLETQLERDMTS